MTEVNAAEAAPESGGMDAHIETLLKDMGDDTTEAAEEGPEGKSDRDDKGRFLKKAKPDDPAEAKEEPKEYTKVSHAAMHEERERRKEEQRLRKDAEAELRRVKEIILVGQTPRAESPPDIEADPIAALKRIDSEMKTRDERTQTEQQRQEEQSRLLGRYQASAAAFRQDQPDFGDAYGYLLNAEQRALSRIYRDPAKLQQKLAEYETDLVREAYDNEENPAQVLYDIARERGYRPKAEQQQSPAAKLESMDRGLKAAKSLGSGGSTPDGDGYSLDELSRLPQAEFDRIWNTYEKRAKGR